MLYRGRSLMGGQREIRLSIVEDLCYFKALLARQAISKNASKLCVEGYNRPFFWRIFESISESCSSFARSRSSLIFSSGRGK